MALFDPSDGAVIQDTADFLSDLLYNNGDSANGTSSDTTEYGGIVNAYVDGAVSLLADSNDKLIADKSDVSLREFMTAYTMLGDTASPITKTLRGLNHALREMPVGVKLSKGLKSRVFVVRPQFNLKSRNLLADRRMGDLLSNTENSTNRYVRMMLDPRLGTLGDNGKVLKSGLVDNNNPFISLITNTFDTISGWPDSIVPIHTSTPGNVKQETIMVDGVTDFHSRFDLDITCWRLADDPLLKLMTTWARYPSLTYRGIMQPYYDFILADEYDYNTRIYQLLLSEDGKFVKGIATTGASIPIAIPDGSQFNINTGASEDPYDEAGQKMTFRVASVGAIYNDPVSVLNFNLVSTYFHPGMKMLNRGNPLHGMEKIPEELRKYLNNDGYPKINLQTMELEWFVESYKLKRAIKKLNGKSNGGFDLF